MLLLFTIITFFATILGGLASIKLKSKIHLVLGFTAGVILGLVALDILPEIFEIAETSQINPEVPMIALLIGFLTFHILEKVFLVHHSQEEHYKDHHHPNKGVASALALTGHSFLDGIGIGLGFQISQSIGIMVAIAIIGHKFVDGLTTGSLMLLNKNSLKKTKYLIFVVAIAPIFGVLSTLLFKLPEDLLILYLGFFAGFLLYISLEDVLPEAHSKNSSLKTITLTVLGIIFIYFITKFTG